jgi:hypothetical protein
MLGFRCVKNVLDMEAVISMNTVKKDDFLIKLTRIYMRAQLSQHYILTITLIDRPTRLIRSHCLLAH